MAFNKFKKLKKRVEAKLPFVNPVNVAKDVYQTARVGIQTLKDGDIRGARANLRAHHFKTIHPLHPTTQKLLKSERMIASPNETEQAEGYALLAEANRETQLISAVGATFGGGLAGGASGVTAAKGAAGAAVSGVKQEQAIRDADYFYGISDTAPPNSLPGERYDYLSSFRRVNSQTGSGSDGDSGSGTRRAGTAASFGVGTGAAASSCSALRPEAMPFVEALFYMGLGVLTVAGVIVLVSVAYTHGPTWRAKVKKLFKRGRYG